MAIKEKGSGIPKASLLKLNGTAVDLQGNVTSSDFFNFLNLPAEHYANLEKGLTPEQALKFRGHVIKLKVGISAVMPMLCFLPDSLVTMADYTQKPISQVKINEKVITHSGRIQKVTNVFQREHKGKVVRFGTNRNSLNMTGWSTPNHEYLTKTSTFTDWIPAEEIKIGQHINYNLPIDSKKTGELDNSWKIISSIEKMEYSGNVYNLEVEHCHSYIVNGFVVHNCGGPRCPVQQCPFHESKSWPLSEGCPIESNLIAAWTRSYVEDIGVDPDNRTEMILINKLVECDIIDYRANIGLSKNIEGWTLIKVDVLQNNGNIQEVSNPHPLLDIKEKNHTARMKVLESFNATRKEKAKKAAMLKQRDEGDVGSHWADMKKFIAAYQKDKNKGSLAQIKQDAREVASSEFIQADWETED